MKSADEMRDLMSSLAFMRTKSTAFPRYMVFNHQDFKTLLMKERGMTEEQALDYIKSLPHHDEQIGEDE